MNNKMLINFEEGQLMTKEKYTEFMKKNKGHSWVSSQQEDGSCKVYSTVIESFRGMEAEIKWYENIYYWLYWRWSSIRNIPRNIKAFIQRGKRGWADIDAWSGKDHLTNVILGIIGWLKHHKSGLPVELNSLAEWENVLANIEFTFRMEQKISGSDLIYIPLKNYDEDVKKWDKTKLFHLMIMSKSDIKKYENGWKLFKKYFGNLWD